MQEKKTNPKSLLSTARGGAFAPHLEERKGALRGDCEASTPMSAFTARREGGSVATSSLTIYKEVVYNFAEYQKDYEQIKSNLDRITFKRRIWQNHSDKKIIYYGLTKKQGSVINSVSTPLCL